MPSNSDYVAAGKELIELQIAALGSVASIATQSAERAFGLSIAVAKASAEDSIAAARKCLATTDSRSVWAVASTLANSNAERMATYNCQLLELRFAARAELAKLAHEQATTVQGKVSALIDDAARKAPAGAEALISLLKKSVAAAQAGFQGANGAAERAAASEASPVPSAARRRVRRAAQP
jgi:phasin protein